MQNKSEISTIDSLCVSFGTIHINLTKVKHMQPQGKEKEKGKQASRLING